MTRAVRPTRYPTTPEGFQLLGSQLSTKQVQLLDLMLRKTEKTLNQERKDLQERAAFTQVVPVSQQKAVDSAIGWRRSIIGLLLLLSPAAGWLLGGLGHAPWGWTIAALGVGGALFLRRLNRKRLSELEVEPVELEALKTLAKKDPTAQQTLKRWLTETARLSQQDFDRLMDYLATQDQLKRWQQVTRQVGQAHLLGPKAHWRKR